MYLLDSLVYKNKHLDIRNKQKGAVLTVKKSKYGMQ